MGWFIVTVTRKFTAEVVTTDWTVVGHNWRALAVKVSISELKVSVATAKKPLMIQEFCKEKHLTSPP